MKQTPKVKDELINRKYAFMYGYIEGEGQRVRNKIRILEESI